MTDGFNLRDLIREVCDTSTIADPATLAKEVSKRIGKTHQRDALEQALPTVIMTMLSRLRGYESPAGGHATPGAHTVGATGRSRKREGIRNAWRKHLRDRITVGPDPSAWKFLADCSVDDLTYARDVKLQHIAFVQAHADRLDQLIDQLLRHGADTVGQLPDDVLGDTLESAA